MKVQSTRLGEMEVVDKDIIQIPEGILGFSGCEKYTWINHDDQESPIELLQSIDDADLTFMLVDPFLFKPDYVFELQEEWKDKLNVYQSEQLTVRAIVTVRSIDRISINLKAPIIINNRSRIAAQIVLDGPEYTLQYFIRGE